MSARFHPYLLCGRAAVEWLIIMISGKIEHENKYDLTAPKFQTAFAFLKRADLAELAEGWYELDNGVRASVQRYTTSPAGKLNFESHARYFDVQYMISGREFIGVVSAENLVTKIPYETEEDIVFYQEPPFSGQMYLQAGNYVVLAPEDAHKPRCAAGAPAAVHKVVVKVPV